MATPSLSPFSSADEQQAFEVRLRPFLKTACHQLKMELGILARVEDGRYEVVVVHDPDESIQVGEVFSVRQTYCERTISSVNPIGFHHASESEWKEHPAYEAFELQAYLGARIMLNGAAWGTVNFSSLLPRRDKITDLEKAIVQRFAEWVGSELQQRKQPSERRKACQLEAELRKALRMD